MQILKYCFLTLNVCFAYASILAQSTTALSPLADAYIRNGTYSSTNFGNDTILTVKSSGASGFTRFSYLKFSVSGLSNISSAKLRIYGRNIDNTSTVTISCYGLDNDSWTESAINFNNAPATSSGAISTTDVNDQSKYYELDVTNFVITQSGGDKVVSFLIKDPANKNSNLSFNSKENSKNDPQLVVTSGGGSTSPSNALLFVENPDKFPSNEHFVFSHIQIPWTRDTLYTVNHDSLRIRVHNNGINTLTVSNLVLSGSSHFKIDNINGTAYNSSSLPVSISSGTYKDVIIKFIAVDQATRIKVLFDSLTIVSNDDKFPLKTVYLNGIWQKKGEGQNEPSSQDIMNAFQFKTSTGYGQTDPDKGDSLKLKGNEIKPSYFIIADASRPVSVTQIAAYHGCCNTNPEKIIWYPKGSTSTLNTLFTHVLVDGQTVLPRKAKPNTPATGTFTPTSAFGFKIGSRNYTDASLNLAGKIGVKVWKALDAKGNIIPNSYILGNDYLGTTATNYDYNDNMYLVKNVKPATGTAFFSELSAAPSDLDFGEKILQSSNSFILNLSSLGKTYSNGSADPAITISSISIAGDNKSEFSASMPAKTTLNPQETTSLTVKFNPASQGLKIADLLIYYNNAQSPLRVPLYGIAKASGVTVTANYRVNSGSSSALTINGKTFSADNKYSFDNLEPYTNSLLKEIAGTDDDALYLKEQSSNGDKKPFRYEFPVSNGDYIVRLHFAELFWGAPGSGVAGGAGSRVMDVSLENKLRLVNFDVTQEVGGATALIKNIPVTVTDGKLNINFSATVNRPMVVAVEVYSFRSPASKRGADINQNAVVSDNSNKNVKVYPNPVDKTLHIQFPYAYTGNSNLQIVDVTGRTYEIGKVNLSGVSNTLEVNISAFSLKSGFYYLRIISETRPTEVIKLVVP